MSDKSLLDIFQHHAGYISDKWEQYLGIYESELRALVDADKPLRLLEIGVQNGGSLQIWLKYLPFGSSIVGIDIDEKCSSLTFPESIRVPIGDASDKNFLDAALGDAGFDIIVDDGSHKSADIIASFNVLLPRLNSGGKYFIEDLHASYWRSHGGGFRTPNSAIEYLKSLIDPLHFDHIETETIVGAQNGETYRSINRQIARISFYDSTAVIEKYRRSKEASFKRVLSGKDFAVSGTSYLRELMIAAPKAMVFSGSSAQDVVAELAGDSVRLRSDVERSRSELAVRTAEFQASVEELARRTAEHHRTIERLEAERAERVTEHRQTVERLEAERAERVTEHRQTVERLEAELTDRINDCDQLRRQIDSLHGSICWRITLPIRWLHKLGNRWLAEGKKGTTGAKVLGGFVGSDEAPPWTDFFDAEWYAERYVDVSASGLAPLRHFLLYGAAERRDPNPAFDTAWYLRAYKDVARAKLIAIEHFVRWGAEQGRLPFRNFDHYRGQAGIAHGSNLEAYRHYLTHERPLGIPRTASGLAVDVEIRCMKEPSFGSEAGLFVTHSPDGWLKPHVLYYVESLRREGIAVVLIVNTDRAWKFTISDLLSRVDGLFIRKNKGFDFAAWAQVLQLRREILDATILYLLNDSLIGPINQSEFSDVIQRVRTSNAAVVGLTENRERGWHLQSSFLAFKRPALRSAAFDKFIQGIKCYEDKHDVISDYELSLAPVFKQAGLSCESIFRALDVRNPTIYHWRELIDSGFPFVKAKLLREVNANDCFKLLSDRGFDMRLASGAFANVEPTDAQPPEPEIIPPPIKPIIRGWPGEVTVRIAAALAEVPWQPPPEQTRAALDQAKNRYEVAKLGVIHRHAGELLTELRAAISAFRAAGVSGDSLIRAVGVMSGYEPPAAHAEHLPSPILRRYREAQNTTSRRFRLDHGRVGTRHGGITFSVLIPVFKTPLIYLERALLSVICQTYSQWELCIVDGSGDADITALLVYYEALDQRVHVAHISHNGGISAAINAALEMATGSYIGLLDADDMLTYDALENVADHLARDLAVDLLYTDECKIDENDIVQRLTPKPDWSPLLMTAFMYVGHFSVYRTSIVRQLGGMRSHYDLSQDYDLALRVADLNPRVAHIRSYCYGWRMIAGAAAIGEKRRARKSDIAALQDAMDRRGWGRTAVALPAANRAFRTFSGGPLVSIVIPTIGNVQLLAECVSAIFGCTLYRNFEVVIVWNYRNAQPEVFPFLEALCADPRIRVIDSKGPFNFSQSCNIGTAAARGEVIIFYNDDVFVLSPDWIQAILEVLTLPGVGAVAPKLLYTDNGIQHAGMVTGTRRLLGTAFHRYPRGTTANMSLAQSVREVSLLSAACLAMPKTVFDQVGGYDEINTPREHSDVDLCFKIRELGYSCVYTPHAELIHVGHVTMGAEESESKAHAKGKHDIYLMKRFGSFIADDPYFPATMRDVLYTESQEAFRFFPRKASLPGGSSAQDIITQPLDIMIFSHDLTESGAPRALFDVARTLRNEGHFVVVASPSDGPYRERLRNVGVDVIIDEVLLRQDRHVSDLARNFDKVICNTIVCWPAVAQLHEWVDVYWYVHESRLICDFAENIPEFTALLKKGIPIWADSRLAGKFLSMYGAEPAIIEYGIDHHVELSPTPTHDADKVVIGVFGTYESRKGQDLAVSGMLHLSHELRAQAELRLFGRSLEPSFRNDIERLASDNPSVVFFGEVDHDECLNQMAACDVILVPSRDDALSFVALDALSLGKTVVCSKTVGASEYLQDGQSALILHENTPEEIGCVLARAIGDSTLRTRVGEGARKVCEHTFNIRSFEEKLHSALGIELRKQRAINGNK